MLPSVPTISYSNYVFTCGSRKLRVCRNIYDFTHSLERRDQINKIYQKYEGSAQVHSNHLEVCNEQKQDFSWSVCAQKELLSVNSEDIRSEHNVPCQSKGARFQKGCLGCSLSCCKTNSSQKCLRLSTNFILQRSDGKESITLLKVEDTFQELEVVEEKSFEFNRKILQGFLFKESGLYFQFGDQANVNKQTENCFYPNWNSFALKDDSFHFEFSFKQVDNGFFADGSISSSTVNGLSSTLSYKVEILPFKNEKLLKSIVENAPKVTNRRKEDQVKDKEEREETNEEFNESSTSTVFFENVQKINEKVQWQTQRKLLKKRTHSERVTSQDDQEDSFSDDDEVASWMSNQQKSQMNSSKNSKSIMESFGNSPIQPKKNVVKNFVKAFRNYVNNWGDESVLLKCLNTKCHSEIKEFRQTYKKFESSHKFNNTFIKALILQEPFKPVFSHFVKKEAWDWLEKSQVNNKRAHKAVLSDYLAAVKDPSKIDSIHSLRTRNRPISKRQKLN